MTVRSEARRLALELAVAHTDATNAGLVVDVADVFYAWLTETTMPAPTPTPEPTPDPVPEPQPKPSPEPPPGSWQVDGGELCGPDGTPWDGAGVNAVAGILIGGKPSPYVFEGLPSTGSYDIWPGPDNRHQGKVVHPGGGVTAATVWSPERGEAVRLPDRAYALNGHLSPAAVEHGITRPDDHWHQAIVRLNCVPRGGGDKPLPADSIPQYVAAVEQLGNLGLVVCPEAHNLTGMNIPIPDALRKDPLAMGRAAVPHQGLADALMFQDLMVEAFITDPLSVWLELPNEPWSSGPDEQYRLFVSTFVRRARLMGWKGLIVVPLAVWGQDLRGLAEGAYDSLRDGLGVGGVDWGLLWSWHGYGARTGEGAYTYASMDADLTAVKNRGYAIVTGEYGQAHPPENGNAGPWRWNVAAVECLATDKHGPALAMKHRVRPIAWSGTGDSTWFRSYALTRSEQVGHGPPMWDVDGTEQTMAQLTDFGRAHWDISHRIAGR